MLRNPQKIDDPNKTGALRKLGGDIAYADLEHLSDDDLARRERISAPHLHMWPLPQAHRAGDLTAANAIAKDSKELHSLRRAAR